MCVVLHGSEYNRERRGEISEANAEQVFAMIPELVWDYLPCGDQKTSSNVYVRRKDSLNFL